MRIEKAALDELRDWLTQRFGDRLQELRLFGSRARGEGDEHSDLDVMIVVDQLASREAREVAYAAGDLLTRFDVLVSPFVISTAHAQRLRDRERRIVRDIDREGVPL